MSRSLNLFRVITDIRRIVVATEEFALSGEVTRMGSKDENRYANLARHIFITHVIATTVPHDLAGHQFQECK